MEIGISSASLYPQLLEDSLQSIGEAGIKKTEIFLNTFSEMSDTFIGKLCEIRDRYSMKITALHPFTSGYEPFLLFQNYRRREQDGLALYKRYFCIAAKLGAGIFVLHGDKSERLGLPLYEYCERFRRLAGLAAAEGVMLTQENVNRFCAADPDYIRRMIENLGNTARFTFDVKQAVRSGFGVWEVYDAMRGHIAHMHLSDHNETSDCLLPGNGDFQFEKLFRIAAADGYDGDAMIEVYANSYKTPEQLFRSCEVLHKRYEAVTKPI